MNSVAPVIYTQDGTIDKFSIMVQLDPENKANLARWSSLNKKKLSTPCHTTNTISDHRVRCIQLGLGCCIGGTNLDRRSVDSRGSSTSYHLTRTLSSLPCDQGVLEGLERRSSTAPSGQYNGGLTYQSQGRYNFSPAIQTSHHNVYLVLFSEHYIDNGTPS